MINLPKTVSSFMEKFLDNHHQIYLVGGTVRGMIMNRNIEDWDFTTSAKPEEILEIFPESFYNNQFGTVGIPVKIGDLDEVFEVTTFRKESDYSNKRHPDKVEWAKTVEEDLARRDFTINAIAYDGTNFIDPFSGKDDIKRKIIKAVGEPKIRFEEDALRLLRALRQATQLGFEIEEKTLSAIKNLSSTISSVSGERVRDEFFKLIKSDHAADGIILLRETGILKIILPEVDACFGVEQKSPGRHHVYDVGTHLVESLRNCPSKDVITRFAVLIHDIGKNPTFKKDPKTKMITFYNHEVVGSKMAEKIADRFKLSKEQKKKLIIMVRHHMFTVSEEQSDKAVRRFIRQVGLENVDDMLDLRVGDRLGSGAKETSWRTELFKKRIVEVQKIPFTVHDLKITGNDVMGVLNIKPSPQVGKIMNMIFDEVDDEKIKNERKSLLKRLDELKE